MQLIPTVSTLVFRPLQSGLSAIEFDSNLNTDDLNFVDMATVLSNYTIYFWHSILKNLC